MASEKCKTQKNTNCQIPFICNARKVTSNLYRHSCVDLKNIYKNY